MVVICSPRRVAGTGKNRRRDEKIRDRRGRLMSESPSLISRLPEAVIISVTSRVDLTPYNLLLIADLLRSYDGIAKMCSSEDTRR